MPELSCAQCGHKWLPKKELVRRCPACKSIRWNQPEGTMWGCPHCGEAYQAKVATASHMRRLSDERHGPTGVTIGKPVELRIPTGK